MRRVLLLLIVFAALSSQACATIFRNKADKISFTSEPEDAEVFVDGESIGRTPVTTELPSRFQYRVEFKKEGFQTEGRYLLPSAEVHWVLLDAILGGLTAVIIDAVTGHWNGLNPAAIRVELRPLPNVKPSRPAPIIPVETSTAALIASATSTATSEPPPREPQAEPEPKPPLPSDVGSAVAAAPVEPKLSQPEPGAEARGTFATSIVAVFEVRDTSKSIPEIQLGLLTEYLMMRLPEVGQRTVLPRKRVADETKRTNCADETCRAAIGRSLAAHEIIFVEIKRAKDRCVVEASLHRLIGASETRTAAVPSDCAMDALFNAIDQAARRLVRAR